MSETTEVQAEIEALEGEIRAKHEKLTELRKSLGPEVVEDYGFLNSEGHPVSLSQLFEDKQDLVVIHNMGTHCPYCTLWADGFNGVLPHLENRAAFVVVSPDPYDVQGEFAVSRGWHFRMVSDVEKRFTKKMGFTTEHDGRLYMLPGYSTFKRRPDGSVFRVAYDHFGPGDPYCSVWHMFGLLDGGIGDWQPQFAYEA
ncbi:MAG: DUF899 family protein [Planctomycetota bacterium]|nr:DUF899 family protein [Planctomycetota bacterium]